MSKKKEKRTYKKQDNDQDLSTEFSETPEEMVDELNNERQDNNFPEPKEFARVSKTVYDEEIASADGPLNITLKGGYARTRFMSALYPVFRAIADQLKTGPKLEIVLRSSETNKASGYVGRIRTELTITDFKYLNGSTLSARQGMLRIIDAYLLSVSTETSNGPSVKAGSGYPFYRCAVVQSNSAYQRDCYQFTLTNLPYFDYLYGPASVLFSYLNIALAKRNMLAIPDYSFNIYMTPTNAGLNVRFDLQFLIAPYPSEVHQSVFTNFDATIDEALKEIPVSTESN